MLQIKKNLFNILNAVRISTCNVELRKFKEMRSFTRLLLNYTIVVNL